MPGLQVAQLQAEAREAAHLRAHLADKESEVAGLRAHLEEALREEVADSDPARLRAAQKRAAALEAEVSAKQVQASAAFPQSRVLTYSPYHSASLCF